MENNSEYRKRADECIRKAENAPNPADRAGWLKLAEEWTTLSRISFRTAPDALEESSY
jgi:hypothetical protein